MRRSIALVTSFALTLGAAGLCPAATVTLKIEPTSPTTGRVPGDTVSYQVRCIVSQGDNLGLATIGFDVETDTHIEQALLQADPAMAGFGLGRGYCSQTGFGGSPQDDDIREIGGAQNTIGNDGQGDNPSYPSDATVSQGVGQTTEGVIIATGQIVLPPAEGTYTISLNNAFAAVLNTQLTSSNTYTVQEVATIDLSPGNFQIVSMIPPPGQITDLLALPSETANAVHLTWTASGGAGRTGTAGSYDIRYSTTPIGSETAWANAAHCNNALTPGASGTVEHCTVTGLVSGQTYYFAIKASAATRIGALSNCTSCKAIRGSAVVLQQGLGGYAGTATTHLRIASPTENYADRTKMMVCGYSDINANNPMRSLVRFDLSTVSPDATIASATLSVYSFDDTALRGSKGYYEACPLTTIWDEAAVTWNRATAQTNWIRPGGDYYPWAQAAKQSTAGVWYNFDVTSIVQAMLTNPVANDGWLIMCANETSHNQDSFASKNYGTVAYRPKLTIGIVPDTTPPATPGSLAAGSNTGDQATLTWIAPGDDGMQGKARRYEIRYSCTKAIATEDDWNVATHCTNVPTPKAAGTWEKWIASGLLPNTTYWFAVRAFDEVDNASGIACASCTTLDRYKIVLQNGLGLYNGTQDSYLYAGGDAYTPYGASDRLRVTGYGTGSNNVQRTIIRFNLSDIAPNTSISNATLSLYAYDFKYVHGSSGFYGAYALTQSWDEWTCTWPFASTGTYWTTAGGDFLPTPDGQAAKQGSAGGQNSWYDFDVTTHIQSMINNPVGNFGWLIKCTDESVHNQDGFASSVYGDQQYRPKLTLTLWHDVTPPAVVSDLAASSADGNSITLTWHAPGNDNNTGTAGSYDIRYSISPITDANFASATPVPGVSAPAIAGTVQTVTVYNLLAGTNYYFAIKTSDNASPANTSPLSNVLQAKTRDTVAPAAVTNLSVSDIMGDSVQLSWTAPSDNVGCTAYDIRYSTSNITNDTQFNAATQVSGATTPASPGTNQNMTVSGLSSNVTYYFAMKTSDAARNWSAISNVVSATTLDNTPPAAITNLSVSNVAANSVQLNWTAPSDNVGCTAYDIRYSTTAITADSFPSATQVTGAPTPASPGTNQSMTVSGLQDGTTYYFAMKTMDNAGNCSGLSNVPVTTTPWGFMPAMPVDPVPSPKPQIPPVWQTFFDDHFDRETLSDAGHAWTVVSLLDHYSNPFFVTCADSKLRAYRLYPGEGIYASRLASNSITIPNSAYVKYFAFTGIGANPARDCPMTISLLLSNHFGQFYDPDPGWYYEIELQYESYDPPTVRINFNGSLDGLRGCSKSITTSQWPSNIFVTFIDGWCYVHIDNAYVGEFTLPVGNNTPDVICLDYFYDNPPSPVPSEVFYGIDRITVGGLVPVDGSGCNSPAGP